MPNWAEGVLKVRGKQKDIMNFLENGFEAVDTRAGFNVITGKEDDREPNKVTFEEDWLGILNVSAPDGLYVRGTRRAFVEQAIEWERYEDDEDSIEVLAIESFKQAWGADAEEFLEIAKEYNLDIRIYVFERGGEFNQDIEIINGKIVKDEEITFDDYEWECIMPNKGG